MDGDEIEAGDPITTGSLNPNDILKVKGVEGVYTYLVQEVQKVYRNQGVDINDKHIEVIGRQMIKKVRIEDNGDTDLFPGSLVNIYDFEEENEKAIAEGKRPATAKRVLLGITKASLATESFLSAASLTRDLVCINRCSNKRKDRRTYGIKRKCYDW